MVFTVTNKTIGNVFPSVWWGQFIVESFYDFSLISQDCEICYFLAFYVKMNYSGLSISYDISTMHAPKGLRHLRFWGRIVLFSTT
jgi:hypothetical protein